MNKYAGALGVAVFILSAAYPNVLMRPAYGLVESTGPGGSNAQAVHQLGQTGQGVNIGVVLGQNVRATHEAFIDDRGLRHAFNYDFTGSGITISSHDTQLAGIIASNGGATQPNQIGVAPGSIIHCARVSDNNDVVSWSWLVAALDAVVIDHTCRVVVTGFEFVSPTTDGNSAWSLLYDYYAYQHGLVFANAAGNQDTYVTIFGDAYNGITTGGLRLNDPNNAFDYRRVGSISGSGPTSDGRRKPDMTAPSQNQTVPTSSSDTAWLTVGTTLGETSYSAPHTAGAAALLLGLADQTPGSDDNRSEVIKAVLVNSAMPNVNSKAGLSTNPANSNNTWRSDRGYGRLDVFRAYQVLNTDEVEPGVTILQDRGWGFGRLSQGQTNTYTINVASRCRLFATVTWQRRIQWIDEIPKGVLEPDELTPYLADLDMTVYAPGQPNPIFSEALFGLSPNNNLEKGDLLVTAPGNYTVVIKNNSTNGESADYGFAFELHPILPGDLPAVDYSVDYSDLDMLCLDWLAADSPLDTLLVPDGIIDFADFALLAEYWLQIDPFYYYRP